MSRTAQKGSRAARPLPFLRVNGAVMPRIIASRKLPYSCERSPRRYDFERFRISITGSMGSNQVCKSEFQAPERIQADDKNDHADDQRRPNYVPGCGTPKQSVAETLHGSS